MRKRRSLLSVPCLALAGVLTLAATPGPAAAEPIVYGWTGTVTFVDEALVTGGAGFAVDDPVSFTVTIDDGVVGQPLSSGSASTYNPIETTMLALGSTTISGGQFDFVGSITVQDSTVDGFRIDRQALGSASLPPDLGIYRFAQIIALLQDSTGSAFSSQALPTSLAREDFSFGNLTVTYRNPDEFSDFASVSISVEDVEVTTAPEPRGAVLLGIVLAAGAALRRSRSQSA